MTSQRKRKPKCGVPIEGKFVPLTFDELDSIAYVKLNGNAAKLYGLLKRAARTVASKIGSRERDVIFDYTYSEAKRCGFAESTFIRAIKELWEKGFIDRVDRGGLRGNGRSNSHYKLASFWKTYGTHWVDRSKSQDNPFQNTYEPNKGEAKW
jgi:hypothetical protein